jgi:Flp pilus assembly pilin Flp
MRHKTRVYRLLASPRGQTMAEYAMILATIALIAAALFTSAGTIVKELTDLVAPMLK